MLNFEIKFKKFIQIQPVVAGKNEVEFQPISIENPENELENLWATAKNNGDVYQSMVGTIKKRKRTLLTFIIIKIFIGDCSLNNNERFFLKKNGCLNMSFSGPN